MEAKLVAKTRTTKGKNEMVRLRRAGEVPGNMISGGKAVTISFPRTSVLKLVQGGLRQSTVIDLQIDSETNKVLVKEVQRHPVNGEIIHVDFYKLTPGKKVTVNIPVRPVGNPIGVKGGGAMEQYYNSVKISTVPEKLQETIDLDVTKLDVGDGIRLSTIKFPEGWDVRLEGDPMILKVARSRMVVEGPEGAPAEGAAPAAGAAAAKAPEKK
jgi:large subunit ribosomal protein L25